MERGQIIAGSIVGFIALLLWIYVTFAARYKGPILSNTYIFASKEEREKIDVKAEYKLITMIFTGLAIGFSSLALYILTKVKWLYVVMWVFMIFTAIYAIVDTIKSETKKK